MTYRATKQQDHYYNQFNDVQNFKIRSKPKQTHRDIIKINSKKLPADFFRPLTRQTIDLEKYPENKANGLKTPCFGEQKPQSYSLSLIPRNKHNISDFMNRIETLPTEKGTDIYQSHQKKNYSRDLSRKQEQYSYRIRCNELPIQLQHQSTQRRQIKYDKKLVQDSEIEKNKGKNIHENRIRLNIKKFFKEEVDELNNENRARRKWKMATNKLPPLV